MRFAEEEGLIVRFIVGDMISVCPPLIITPAEIDELFDRLARALDRTLDWAKRETARGYLRALKKEAASNSRPTPLPSPLKALVETRVACCCDLRIGRQVARLWRQHNHD